MQDKRVFHPRPKPSIDLGIHVDPLTHLRAWIVNSNLADQIHLRVIGFDFMVYADHILGMLCMRDVEKRMLEICSVKAFTPADLGILAKASQDRVQSFLLLRDILGIDDGELEAMTRSNDESRQSVDAWRKRVYRRVSESSGLKHKPLVEIILKYAFPERRPPTRVHYSDRHSFVYQLLFPNIQKALSSCKFGAVLEEFLVNKRSLICLK